MSERVLRKFGERQNRINELKASLERAEARIVALEDECVVLRSGVTAETVSADAAEARAARLAEAGERLLCHDIHAHSCSLCEPMHSALADDSSEAWLAAKLEPLRVELRTMWHELHAWFTHDYSLEQNESELPEGARRTLRILLHWRPEVESHDAMLRHEARLEGARAALDAVAKAVSETMVWSDAPTAEEIVAEIEKRGEP